MARKKRKSITMTQLLHKIHNSKSRRKRPIILLFVSLLALVGAWVLTNGEAAHPVATTSCGARIQNYNYQVPFGNAVWNQPVCGLPRHPRSADYATRLLEWGHTNDGSPSSDVNNGNIGVNPGFPKPTLFDPEGLSGLFTREVYLASQANTEKKVASIGSPSNIDGEKWNSDPAFPREGYESNHPEGKIPWNSSWKTGKGGDNEIIILDDRPGQTQGQIYTIWIYEAGGCVVDALIWPGRVCATSIQLSRAHDGRPIDYRTHEGYVSERGVGLSYYSTLVTPDEVAAGEIRHALGFSIPNTSFGPICNNQQLGTSSEGVSCGTAVAPASKFEHGSRSRLEHVDSKFQAIYTLDKTIPEGMRFAIDITDSEIDAWISSRSNFQNNPRRAETARIFARALRDFGMIVVDTNGARPDIQMVGGINPENAQKWKNLGITPEDSSNDLLKGLITSENLYVVDPPTVTCADGSTSKHYCKWTSASYGSITNPPADTTKPTISITSPVNNSQQNGQFVVAFSASDNVGVVHAEIFVDGVSKKVFNAQPYELSLNTSSLGSGVHTITVEAKDSAGNTGSSSVSITVPSTTPVSKPCDFDNSGLVDLSDLARLLANWKKTVVIGKDGDCNGVNGVSDGKVQIDDLGKLLALWKK